MRNIDVVLLTKQPKAEQKMMALANLTQKGHTIKNGKDFENFWQSYLDKDSFRSSKAIANMKHGTIKRNDNIEVAIVGGSRRLLAQLRTPQVGVNFVSASMQYSNWQDGSFVVPYEVSLLDYRECTTKYTDTFLAGCQRDMEEYKSWVELVGRDAAAYRLPTATRNVLYISGSVQFWQNFLAMRLCHRNTTETQYVMWLIWEQLLNTEWGQVLLSNAGPDCTTKFGCQEGKMCCGRPITLYTNGNKATDFLDNNFSVLRGDKHE